MSYRITHSGLVIETGDAHSVVALVKAFSGVPMAAAQVARILPPQPQQSKPKAQKKSTETRGYINGHHARSNEHRQEVAQRRESIVAMLRSGGEMFAHELSTKLPDYPKAAMFNDLNALEKAGRITRGERGYVAVEVPAEVDPLAMTESPAHFDGLPA